MIRTSSAAAIAILSSTAALAQVTVFEENFFGDGDPLNGKTPDTTTNAEAWEAGSEWGDDGIHFSPSTAGQAAHLDYAPQAGRVYTASTRVRNPHANALGFGFLPDDPASGDWSDEAFDVRHNDAPGYGWIRLSDTTGPDQAAYLGPGVDGAQPWNGDLVSPDNFLEIDIVLDTTADQWTVQWFINQVSQGPADTFGVTGNPGIGGVGFSRDPDAVSSGSFVETSFFRLTYVPEPTSLAMLGLGGIVLTRRRR